MLRRHSVVPSLAVCAFVACATARSAAAQDHQHTAAVSGAPQGIPFFCSEPTVTSVTGGSWSSAATWSTGRVPGQNDRVLIAAGLTVTYDTVSDARISCIDVRGHLAFRTDAQTRLRVVNVMVFENGSLEVGTSAKPVAPGVTAEIVIADQLIDPVIDPGQLGNGIIALGKVTMHGAVKAPTFLRVAREPLAGQVTLTFGQAVSGWKAGDELVIPDTRQLRDNERGANYTARDEKVLVASISGAQVTLTAPLAFDHKGARTPGGTLEFLPHVGNVSRNVVVRSENPLGTRGHTFFINHADVDLRYAEFREMGRTKAGVLDNTEFDAKGQVVRLGTNQIGRYAIHFHHDFGPRTTPANGYQFTLIGNAVVTTPKWGVTVHNSSYGLVQDNVVYNSRGTGIATEDGSESFNVFDHNFSMRSEGSGDFAPRSGYGGPAPDPGGEGGGFWFRGQNNYVRNNVSANGDAYGYGMAAGSLGTVRVPKFKGADTSLTAESVAFDTTDAPILEFANNEAYGTMQTGMACGWSGTITNFTVWHSTRHGLTGTPTDTLTIDRITVLGDAANLKGPYESSAGVWLANYMSKNVVVRNADVQGMRTGIASPFFSGDQQPEQGRGDGSFIVENGHFRTLVGVVVATAYSSGGSSGKPAKNAVVRGITFEPLAVENAGAPEAISMNFGMAPNDPRPRDPIQVFDFNQKAGDNFKLYYSYEAPPSVAPCHDSRPNVGGWVCK